MVALQFLVLSVEVRILVEQQIIHVEWRSSNLAWLITKRTVVQSHPPQLNILDLYKKILKIFGYIKYFLYICNIKNK